VSDETSGGMKRATRGMTMFLLGCVWAGGSFAQFGPDDKTSVTQHFENMHVVVSDSEPDDGIAPLLSVSPETIGAYISTFEWMGGNTHFFANVGIGTQIDISFDFVTHGVLDKRYTSLIDMEAGGWCSLGGGACNQGPSSEYVGGRFVIASDGIREGVIEKTFVEHIDFQILNWHDETRQLHLTNEGGGHIYIALPPYEPSAVPEPATYALMGTGLAALALAGRRRVRGGSPRAA